VTTIEGNQFDDFRLGTVLAKLQLHQAVKFELEKKEINF
jgi:hypothetical protein